MSWVTMFVGSDVGDSFRRNWKIPGFGVNAHSYGDLVLPKSSSMVSTVIL